MLTSLIAQLQNYKAIVYALLVGYVLFTIAYSFMFTSYNAEWSLADWLVNYEDGGFKRRGLSGNLFFGLQDLTGWSLPEIVFAWQTTLHALFAFLFYLLIRNKRINLEYVALLLSPLALVFMLNNTGCIGRKEIMLMVIFLYFVLELLKGSIALWKDILIGLLLGVATLMHEIVLFYLPYFIFARFWFSNQGVWDLKRSAIHIVSVAVPVVALLLWGSDINNGESMVILAERGVSFKGGIFFWNTPAWDIYTEEWINYTLYLIPLIYSIVHLKWFTKRNSPEWRTLIRFYLIAILFSLPLFVLAIDWGRFMFIHFMLTIILISAKLPVSTSWKENAIDRNDLTWGYVLLFLVFFTLRIEMVRIGIEPNRAVMGIYRKLFVL